MGGRARRRTGALEDLDCERRRFKHGFGCHLDAVPNPGAIIKRYRARPNAHVKELTVIRLFILLLSARVYVCQPAVFPPAEFFSSWSACTHCSSGYSA